MRKLLLLVLLWTSVATAQVVGPGFVDYVTSAPSGACSQGAQQQNVLGSGDIWTCQSGTWAKAGGSGGGGCAENTCIVNAPTADQAISGAHALKMSDPASSLVLAGGLEVDGSIDKGGGNVSGVYIFTDSNVAGNFTATDVPANSPTGFFFLTANPSLVDFGWATNVLRTTLIEVSDGNILFGNVGPITFNAAGNNLGPQATTVGSLATGTNCASAGGTCGSAASGAVTIAAAATTVTVATTAVHSASRVLITENSTLGTPLSVTCNTTVARTYAVTTITDATSFVITSSVAPSVNPACIQYFIVN